MGLGRDGVKNEDQGLTNQVKGKVNEVTGAAVGDLGQEVKGKVQKNVGKVQEKISRLRSTPSGVPLSARYAMVCYPQDGVTEVELVRNLLTRIAPPRSGAANA